MLQYIQQNPYEVGGFFTSLLCVWLNARENVWGWFWAIISSLLSAKLFYDQKLFGDMYLQFFFVASAFYGIYIWLYGGKEVTVRAISYLPAKEALPTLLAGIGIFCFFVWLLFLQRGDVIYLDALTTALSIMGQWLMIKKYIENWWVWILVNILYVGMYAYKLIFLYTILYAIFIGLAIYGFLQWRKLYKLSSLPTSA